MMETLIHFIENELHHIATIVKLIIEAVAISIIVFSTIRTIPKFIRTYKKRDSEVFYHEIRLDLGLSLALSLEFLLAADIVGTAVTPSWEAIGLLAAIAAIRTFLNYFLHQEVKELEAEKLRGKEDYI